MEKQHTIPYKLSNNNKKRKHVKNTITKHFKVQGDSHAKAGKNSANRANIMLQTAVKVFATKKKRLFFALIDVLIRIQ